MDHNQKTCNTIRVNGNKKQILKKKYKLREWKNYLMRRTYRKMEKNGYGEYEDTNFRK